MHCKRKPHVLREGQYVEVKLFSKIAVSVDHSSNLPKNFVHYICNNQSVRMASRSDKHTSHEEVSLSNSYKVVKYHYGAH